MPNTLPDWLTYLESLHPKTIALGLERVAQVKQRLNLQANFPIITVGGTNGKGSVCAMLESMLHAAGYRVGCYTSPHLLDYNERVRIGKKQANDAELCASFEKIEQARGDIPLTYFEFGTLAAMQCFISHKVDVAILEVGLGGRLDAVNVFDSDCAVVTSVDIDHTDYLGDTREQIAFEKAGIFRTAKVAICGDLDMPDAIANEAQRIGAELWRIGNEFRFEENLLPSPAGGRGIEVTNDLAVVLGQPSQMASSSISEGSDNGVRSIFIAQSLTRPHGHPLPPAGEGRGQWDYRSTVGARNALPYPALRGAYQLNNASAALAALDALKDKLPVNMEAVRRGLVEVSLPGRFQVLPGSPQLILDVAHNPHAARSLAQNLASLPACPRTFAVFAMLKDKDIAGVVRALKGQVDVWLVAGINAPRGATAAEAAMVLATEGVTGTVREFPSIENALLHACNEASENDRIAAFGSFYTVAEVMRVRGLRHA
jgi:dihydrofolate synthase/folylpolyglutamate synthase